MMQTHERERLHYSPQLEYIKELILSEGVAGSLSPELERRLIYPASSVRELAKELEGELSGLLAAMEERLVGAEGFAAYKASLAGEEPADLSPWEAGPRRADFLLYRTLYRTHTMVSTTAGIFEFLVDQAPEEEAETLRRWAEAEERAKRIQEELARLGPLIVDGSPGAADEQYAKLSAELDGLEHEMAVRRMDLAGQMAPAFAPYLLKTKEMLPRMYELVYGAMTNDIRGNPEPLLNTLLSILVRRSMAVVELRRMIRTLRSALRVLANIRAVLAKKAVDLFASYIGGPVWRTIYRIVQDMRHLHDEIFWPLFAILELLADSGPEPEGLEGFATRLIEFMQMIERGSDELVKEAKRLERSALRNLKASLDEVQQLKQLEGFMRMLDALLAEIERLPLDLANESERRRFVRTLVQSQRWDVRYDPAMKAYQALSTGEDAA